MLKKYTAGMLTRVPKIRLRDQDGVLTAIVGVQATLVHRSGRLVVSVLMLIGMTLPSAAQQLPTVPGRPEASASAPGAGRQQTPLTRAVNINARRSGLYQRQDTESIAALYTAEATYIELMPVLQIFKGRDQIKTHLEELIGASAVGLVPTVTDAENNPDGTILVAGDYVVFSQEKTESVGHFFQSLRWEDGAWRIATHVFARPDPLTTGEKYPHD